MPVLRLEQVILGWKSCTVLLCNNMQFLRKLGLPLWAPMLKKELAWILIKLLAFFWHYVRAYSQLLDMHILTYTRMLTHTAVIDLKSSSWPEMGCWRPHISDTWLKAATWYGEKWAVRHRWGRYRDVGEDRMVLVPHINESQSGSNVFFVSYYCCWQKRRYSFGSGVKNKDNLRKKWVVIECNNRNQEKRSLLFPKLHSSFYLNSLWSESQFMFSALDHNTILTGTMCV